MTAGGTGGMYVVTGGLDKVTAGAPNEVTAVGWDEVTAERGDLYVVTGVCCMTPGGT